MSEACLRFVKRFDELTQEELNYIFSIQWKIHRAICPMKQTKKYHLNVMGGCTCAWNAFWLARRGLTFEEVMEQDRFEEREI